MPVYLVVFDVDDLKEDAPAVLSAIEKYSWARLNKKAFALYATDQIDSVYSELEAVVSQDHSVYVFMIQGPWGGFGDISVSDWLNDYLSPC